MSQSKVFAEGLQGGPTTAAAAYFEALVHTSYNEILAEVEDLLLTV